LERNVKKSGAQTKTFREEAISHKQPCPCIQRLDSAPNFGDSSENEGTGTTILTLVEVVEIVPAFGILIFERGFYDRRIDRNYLEFGSAVRALDHIILFAASQIDILLT
jgi:hypothetical protein